MFMTPPRASCYIQSLGATNHIFHTGWLHAIATAATDQQLPVEQLECLLATATAASSVIIHEWEVHALFGFMVEHNAEALLVALLRQQWQTRVKDPAGFAQRVVRAMVHEGHARLVQLFLERQPIDLNAASSALSPSSLAATASMEDSRAPLLIAVEQDNVAMVAVLLAGGADPHTLDPVDGFGALHVAAEWNSVPILHLLVDAGADVDARTEEGDSPLHIAVHHGHIEAVQFLFSRRANLRLTNQSGASALHLAAREGHTDLIELLLRHGADVQAQDTLGQTPLHTAAFFDESAARFATNERDTQQGVIQTLLAHGADINARDGEGMSVLHCAQAGRFDAIVDFLRVFDPQPSPQPQPPQLPQEYQQQQNTPQQGLAAARNRYKHQRIH